MSRPRLGKPVVPQAGSRSPARSCLLARLPHLHLAALLLGMPVGVLAQPAPAASAPDAARGAKAWAMCASCHGPRGEGMASVDAPALGGQTPAYLERQLRAYRSDQRGSHLDDVAGNRMRMLAKSIPGDALVADIAAHLATLPAAASDRQVPGRMAAGRKRFVAVCAPCHGAQGEGRTETLAPRIAGLGDQYLLRQLQHFKAGLRDGPPASPARQMREVASTAWPDERAARDLVAYLATLAGSPP